MPWRPGPTASFDSGDDRCRIAIKIGEPAGGTDQCCLRRLGKLLCRCQRIVLIDEGRHRGALRNFHVFAVFEQADWA